MDLCSPRGPLSEQLLRALHSEPGTLGVPPAPSGDPLAGDDFQLSLYLCYQLHYRSFNDVDDRWEWSPELLAIRQSLEERFENALRAHVTVGRRSKDRKARDVASELQRLIDEDPWPSLSSYLETHGTPEEFREFVVHRSIYHLQEADPHTWAIPRLEGPAKAALVMIQADEYGNGRYDRMHSTLFESVMRAFDLHTGYGAYVDHVPGTTLATVNLMSLFGLNRRLRGALVGHLAAFEMTSVGPNGRYGNALRGFGYGPEATGFYDEHVTADETHGLIASQDLAAAFASQEPSRAADILFGAAALLFIEGRFTERLLTDWTSGRSSLTRPLIHAFA